MQDTLFRSLMFVPAHNSKLVASALKSDADILLLDLEDSVQPRENKAVARQSIKNLVADLHQSAKVKNHTLCPRINDIESGMILDDLVELSIPGVWGFMCPKSQNAEDIHFVDRLLSAIEAKKGLPNGTFNLVPLIETTSAVLNASEICKASRRVKAIAFGCEDFVTDLGGVHDSEGLSIFTARSMIAMAAKSAGVVPIDTVHIKVHDLEDLERNLILAKKLGYEGMLVLHPKELDLVHRYFSPSADEINHAAELIRDAQLSYSEGKGVSVIGSKFIGPPMVQAAENLLKKAGLISARTNQ